MLTVNHDGIACIGSFHLWPLETHDGASADVPTADEDGALLRRGAVGDDSAWQELFDKWKRPLLAFFYRALGSMPEAEDLTLEVFVRLHRGARRYEPRAQFSTYLFHIARNLLLNERRRRQRKPAQPLPPEAFDYIVAPGSDEQRRAAELEEVFQQALAQMPEAQRTLLLLVQQQQLDHHAAAGILGITENTLRVQLHRARERLKTLMSVLP